MLPARSKGWDAEFEVHPVPLPDGGEFVTLAQARAYILALPEAIQAEPRWLAAVDVLLKAAEHGDPFLMMARVAVYRAIYGDDPTVRSTGPRKAKTFSARRKLTRDK